MAANELTFDADKHEYRISGSVVPSVTGIINAILPGFQADPYYLQRGTAIHHGCALSDRGDLDWQSVSPEIEPRIKAWVAFRQEWKAEPVAIEMPIAHDLYRYAGTLDRMFNANGDLVVCDLKSSISPQVRLQLAGYSLAWKSNHPKQTVKSGVAVELRDDGSYRTLWLSTAELRRAEQQFMGVLSTYSFAKENNLLKGAA